jgi:hypothetical protein
MMRTTSRPNRTSQGCGWPDAALSASSVSAVCSAGTGTPNCSGAADRPGSPHRKMSPPSAAGGALSVTVTVLVTPLAWCSTRWVTSACPASARTEATGPSEAHSSEISCGARSHSAPLSRRHGVLNGLESCQAVPSQTATPPAQGPSRAIWSSQALISA